MFFFNWLNADNNIFSFLLVLKFVFLFLILFLLFSMVKEFLVYRKNKGDLLRQSRSLHGMTLLLLPIGLSFIGLWRVCWGEAFLEETRRENVEFIKKLEIDHRNYMERLDKTFDRLSKQTTED